LDKSRYLLELEIEQLQRRLDADPEHVLALAEQCLVRSKQIHFNEGAIQCLLLMSHCADRLSNHQRGIKLAKEALSTQHDLDTDEYLPEILHLHAIHSWGEKKYYTAQQYWINALEQAALEEDVESELECLMGLGNVWRVTNQLPFAAATHELAVKVANNTRQTWLEGRARLLWAWDLYLLNNFAEMLTVLDVAMELLDDHPNNRWKAEIWDFRALALLGLERLEDADEATNQAHEIAVQNDLSWMKAHSFISRARLELLRKNVDQASLLLQKAEEAINRHNDDELLSQIYYQQSIVAEEKQNYPAALSAFRRYRKISVEMEKQQTTRESHDKARALKRQLEQRARKLINRVRGQYEYDPEKHLSNVVSETYWWEQLVLFKTELRRSNHSVIVVHHNTPAYLDICTELMHSLCTKHDFVSRLSTQKLGLLLADKDDNANTIFEIIKQMLAIYPWQRRGLNDALPNVALHDILTFPFTLEQLEQIPMKGEGNGSATE
jgi:tetratricopeptide (TPR) repeat protein